MRLAITASLFVCLTVSAASAQAAGYSEPAVPTKIDMVRSEGFMLFGAFGNPGGCAAQNQLFIKSDHPQYKQLLALAMMAYTTKQKIVAYVHGCEPVVWYSVASHTYNTVIAASSLAIQEP